jgi:acyl carrier protein
MNREDIAKQVLNALHQVAPEANLEGLDPRASFREQLDLDSMDQLNFALALHRSFGLEIPERDYPKLATLGGCVEYFERAAAKA